ncbi:hypothetical protein GCM10007973_14570 [Polymorphobacter multimanifer]|nr:hypothetical protein GCM10007973_14570 [Polymorphobacter multimanifer]
MLLGERVKILSAEVLAGASSPGITTDDAFTIGTGEGLRRPTRVQRAGKPAMAIADMLRGWPIPAGTPLA